MVVDRRHQAFTQPSNPDIRVWRYMNLAKYISFIQNKSLYFSQLKVLSKSDPYEGSTTKEIYEKIERGDNKAVNFNNQRLIGLSTFYINCWHMNETESFAMWKLYSSSFNEAVCIQSTYNKIADSLPKIRESNGNGYFMGTVKYINHHLDSMPEDAIAYPIMHKLESFDHEREARIVYWKRDPGTENLKELDNYLPGIEVPIDINSSIENVIVSPIAANWFFEVIKCVTKKYDIDINVSKSSLALLPYS